MRRNSNSEPLRDLGDLIREIIRETATELVGERGKLRNALRKRAKAALVRGLGETMDAVLRETAENAVRSAMRGR